MKQIHFSNVVFRTHGKKVLYKNISRTVIFDYFHYISKSSENVTPSNIQSQILFLEKTPTH